MEEHLGYPKYAAEGRNGGNSRNGSRTKTVITDVGSVELDVPRDRDDSFEPDTVRKNQRRLDDVDSMVISLTAKGLTTGEVEAHLAEVYSTSISRETISKITNRVLGELAEWATRPLDRVYPVIFIDAIVVKIRDGQVANRRVYAAIGVTVDGQRDILGLWVGAGGEGAIRSTADRRVLRRSDRAATRHRRSQDVLAARPLGPSAQLSGVSDEVPIDDVGEPTLQRSNCFLGRFALGDFAVVKRATEGVVAELGDRDDVDGPVQLPVASRVQPVPDLGAR